MKKEKGSNVTPIAYDFASIAWKGTDLSGLKEHLLKNLDLIEEYPERDAGTIVRMLSRRLEVKENEVIVTDGATGAIHLIAGTAEGATSMILPPTNQEFRHALDRAKHTIIEEKKVKDLSKLNLEGVDYLWLSNPNSPDGRLFSRRSLITLLREHPQVKVIIDLSMSSYVVEDNIKASDIYKYPNLIVIGSFSKAYNVAGLRVGYVVANSERIVSYRQNYTPRCVGTVALEAARYILLHPAQFTIPIRKWLRDSMELADALEHLYGIEIQYGATPFFILKLQVGTASELASFLWDKYHIKIGTSADDIDLKADEVRICGFTTAKPNELLIAAIKEYTNQYALKNSEE